MAVVRNLPVTGVGGGSFGSARMWWPAPTLRPTLGGAATGSLESSGPSNSKGRAAMTTTESEPTKRTKPGPTPTVSPSATRHRHDKALPTRMDCVGGGPIPTTGCAGVLAVRGSLFPASSKT